MTLPFYTLGGVAYEAVPCRVHGIVLRKAARQKLQEGATKEVNGVTYVLNKNRRWTRAEPRGKRRSTSRQATVGQPQPKPTRKPRAKAVPQQLPLIPDVPLSATAKPKARKNKQLTVPPPSKAPDAVGKANPPLLLAPGNLTQKNDEVRPKEKNAKPLKDRIKSIAIHEGDELGRNVAAWKIGKVIGGAIAQHAIAMGAPPEASQLISETVVQASSATALWAVQQARKGKLNARDTAAFFVSQSAAAALGKMAHHGAEEILHSYQADAMMQSVGALISGKATGIGTVVGMNKSKLSHRIVDHVVERSRHDIDLILAAFSGRKSSLAKSGAVEDRLADLLWELHQAGVTLAAMQYQTQS